MNNRARAQFSRLVALAATSKAQRLANPEPYLDRAHTEVCRTRELLEEVQRALSPEIVMEWAQDHAMQPMDIQGEALIRCEAAQRVLDAYLKT